MDYRIKISVEHYVMTKKDSLYSVDLFDGILPDCHVCEKEFHPKSSDSLYCSTKCKNRAKYKRRRQLLHALKDVPCMDCEGEFNPWQMDFDHRPDEEKLFGVGASITRRWEDILLEIEKCDIVCSNCHRDRTYTRNQEEC